MDTSEQTPTPPPTDHDDDASPRPAWEVFGIGAIGGYMVAALIGLVVVMVLLPDAPAEDPSDTDTPAELLFVATEFAFTPATATVEPGDVALSLRNDGVAFHDLAIEGIDGFALEADPGLTDAGSVQLAPGTYTLICRVPGHRGAGMEATLEVAPG